MSRDKDFKRLVRRRMGETGERYTDARRQVLAPPGGGGTELGNVRLAAGRGRAGRVRGRGRGRGRNPARRPRLANLRFQVVERTVPATKQPSPRRPQNLDFAEA